MMKRREAAVTQLFSDQDIMQKYKSKQMIFFVSYNPFLIAKLRPRSRPGECQVRSGEVQEGQERFRKVRVKSGQVNLNTWT